MYPAASIGEVAPLAATKAELEEARRELKKELGIDINKLNESLLKTQKINFGLRIRQIQEENSNKIAKYNNRNNDDYYKKQIESSLKSIYFLAASNPKDADKILRGIENNPQYEYLTKSPAWAGIKSDLTKMARVTPITFTSSSEIALSKGNATVGRNPSMTPGQEFAQRGTRGSKAGNMLLKNVGKKKSSANVNVGNVSAQSYNYAKATGQSANAGVGVRHARTTDHTSGQDLRSSMKKAFIKGNSKISKAVWMQEAQKAKKTKEMKAALRGELSEEAKAELFDFIFPEEAFAFGRDYEQVLVSEQISHVSGRGGKKNIITSLRDTEQRELDTNTVEKIRQKTKELLLKINKKNIKDNGLIDKYLETEKRKELGENDLKQIEKYVSDLEGSLSEGQLDYVQQAAARQVLHLKGKNKYHIDFEDDENGVTIARIKEYAQLQTSEKIAFESGLHGVVITVKNAILAQALIKAGFDPKDIFNSDGSLNVHAIAELKNGSRKMGENVPTIINEFTSLKSKAIKAAKTSAGKKSAYEKAKGKFSDAFKEVSSSVQPILNKLGIKTDDFVDKYFQGFTENGEFILGNYKTIFRELITENDKYDSLDAAEKKNLSEQLGFDFLSAFVVATGSKSQFRVKENSIEHKHKGGYIATERMGIQDVSVYFDPKRKGGRPVNMGYKMIDDFGREADAAVKAGILSKEDAALAKSVLQEVHKQNKDLSEEENSRVEGLVGNIVRDSQKTLDEINKEGGYVQAWNDKVISHKGLEQVTVDGRRGFRLKDFDESIFGDVLRQQQEGKDAYLDYAYNYTDEKGNNIKGDAIRFGDYLNAFEIIEDENGEEYLIPKNNAEGFLALENIKTMETLIHNKRSAEDQLNSASSEDQKERIRKGQSEAAAKALIEMTESVTDKDSEKYKAMHNSHLSHSAFSRIVSGGDSGIFERGAVGVVSADRLRAMLQQAEGEDEKGYVKGLYREAKRLGIKITDKDTPKTVIEKIINAVDIDNENFDVKKSKGLLQFLTRFPLLNGQNLPITELFASSKRGLGDAIEVDRQVMDMLNADVDGDTIASALANVRSEFNKGNITAAQAKAYTKTLEAQLKMFRKRTKLMSKFEKQNKDLYEEKPGSKEVISLEDFASEGNPLAATAAELATRQNRDKIGVFDNIRQGFLNSVKGKERFQNSVGAQFASEFFTSMSQDAISSKKIFERLLNQYGSKENIGDALGIDASLKDEDFINAVVTNIGSEIETALKDESTFTTESG